MLRLFLPILFIFSFSCLSSESSERVRFEFRDFTLSDFARSISPFLDKPVFVNGANAPDSIIDFNIETSKEMIIPFLRDFLNSQDLYIYEREFFYFIHDQEFSVKHYENYRLNVRSLLVETNISNDKVYNVNAELSSIGVGSPVSVDGGLSLFSNSLSYDVAFDFFNKDANSTIVSSPSISVMNNEVGSIQVGQNVPVIESSTDSAEGSLTTQSITRLDIGVKLSVTPSMINDNSMSLLVESESSSLSPSSAASDVIINQKTVSTTTIVKSGDMLHLGGLIESGVSEEVSRTPFLSDLWLVGDAFTNTSKSEYRTRLDIYIFIDSISPIVKH